MSEKTTTLELEVEVEYSFEPGEAEVRYYKNGDGHPGYPDSVELEHVWLSRAITDKDGKMVLDRLDIIDFLGASDIRALEEEMLEHAASEAEDNFSEPDGDDGGDVDPGPWDYPEPKE